MPATPSDVANQSEIATNDRPGTAELSEHDRHRVLASERRRVLLDVVDDRTPPIELEDLAVAIAEREEHADPDAGDTLKRVALSLHHNHLPRMSGLDLVAYDPVSRRIESVTVDGLR